MMGEINQLVPYERILNHCYRYPEIPLGLGNTLGPPGVPRAPERASEESNDTRHVGCQFSQFSTLKMSTGALNH